MAPVHPEASLPQLIKNTKVRSSLHQMLGHPRQVNLVKGIAKTNYWKDHLPGRITTSSEVVDTA